MNRNLLWLLVAVVLFGCSEQLDETLDSPGLLPISLTGSIAQQNLTRANEQGFVSGDRFGDSDKLLVELGRAARYAVAGKRRTVRAEGGSVDYLRAGVYVFALYAGENVRMLKHPQLRAVAGRHASG